MRVLRQLLLMTAGTAAMGIAGGAWAQAAVNVPPQAEEDQAAAQASSEIVVTGSRTTRDGSDQPTPVQVVSTADLIKTAPGNIADGLNQLPVFQNSISNNAQQFTQGNRQRTGNYLNLRSLGTQRVLVLLDGQRLPPSGTNGGVDVTLVPQLLTQRVDVVTGGASAVYGSDAVSGVVNFIIDKRFKGLKAQAQRGISSRGDNGSYRLSLAAGTSLLDDRLHVIASAERFHFDGLDKTDRPDIGRSFQSVGAGTAADPIRVFQNVRFSNVTEGGVIVSGPLGPLPPVAGQPPMPPRFQFGPDGRIIPFVAGTITPTGVVIGGDGALVGQSCCTFTPQQTANQIFGRANYEFSDTIEGFVLGSYNWSSNSDRPVPTFRGSTIFRDNAYLQPALTPAVLAALGNAQSFNVSKIFNNRPGNKITQFSKSLNIQAGLSGKLADLDWNVGYTHGWTSFRVVNIDTVTARYIAAQDAVHDPSGQIVCRVTLTNPGLYPGCVPLNIFGIGNESDAAYDYVNGESRYKAINKLDSFQATLAGSLFEGWAGPITFAVGGEYRKQSLNQTSNSDPALAKLLPELRGVPAGAQLVFSTTNVGPARGKYNVKEAFAEITVPVLRDSAIGSAELNGAARVTDYSTSGTVETWKVGGIFDPIRGVRFRATLSRDIRAPTLFELFASQTSTGVTFADPLTKTQQSSRQIGGGNPNLKPEIAKTLTAGIVLKPDFLPGLTFSADYFKIRIKDAIATPFSAFQLVTLCSQGSLSADICSAIVRPLGPTNADPSNGPTEIFTTLANVAVLKLSGIDFEANYVRPIGNGRLSIRAAATRQITFDQATAQGQPLLHFAGSSDFNDVQFPLPLPKWRAAFSVGYDDETFGISVQERLIGKYKRTRQPPPPAGIGLIYVDNSVPTVAYTDLNVTFKLAAGSVNYELFGTVNNLFDKDPPLVPVTRTAGLTVPTIRSTYDTIGRYITVGVRLRM